MIFVSLDEEIWAKNVDLRFILFDVFQNLLTAYGNLPKYRPLSKNLIQTKLLFIFFIH